MREEMRAWFVKGSNPGLALATTAATDEMTEFERGPRPTWSLRADAQTWRSIRADCHLEGLGGTNQGIIGALAALSPAPAVTTAASCTSTAGRGGTVFTNLQSVAGILERGVARRRNLEKHLRAMR